MELVVTRHVTRTVWSRINCRVDLDKMTKEFNEALQSYDNADELPVLTPDLLARIIKDELDDSNPEDRAVIDFEAPMANLLTDFYDQLKSATSGYASFNYELNGYKTEDLVRVDFLVGGHKIDALSIMCHRSEADAIGRETTKKLKEVIPRQNWEVAIQAAIGARIIARETIGAYRKDVTVKIHTGDRDRKAKLLEKQKRGKARMKRFGKIDIPSEAFTVLLKRD